MRGPVVLIDTSRRQGSVGLALNGELVEKARLDPERSHAQDLTGAISRLVSTRNYSLKDVTGVIAARGPGSYTGLRVGLMTAITLAYATAAKMVGVSSFHALAEQIDHTDGRITVLADGFQGGTYFQSFRKESGSWIPAGELAVASQIPDECPMVILPPRWAGCPDGVVAVDPELDGLLAVGLPRLAGGEHDSIADMEPLYIQPSSAERQWRNLGHA